MKTKNCPKVDIGVSPLGLKEPTPIKASFLSSFLNFTFYAVSSSSRLDGNNLPPFISELPQNAGRILI